MSFWDFFWLLVWWSLFFYFLMVLFMIVGDLFGDRELSGWVKAVWLIFLILFPPLTVLVYLIARGKGMAERRSHEAQAAKSQTDNYIRSVAQQSSPTDQIASAKSLLDSGAISQAEYDQLKAKALA